MIQVISNYGCGRCLKVKSELNRLDIKHSFRYIDELNDETSNRYMEMAREAGQQEFPIVIKNNEILEVELKGNKLTKLGNII